MKRSPLRVLPTAVVLGTASLLALNAHAGAVSAAFDLDGNGTLESSAASNSVPFICSPCTITHTVTNGLPAGMNQSFNWTGPGFRGFAVASGAPVSTVSTTYLSVVEAPGNIVFTPINGGGPAQYNKPVVSAVVYFAGDLISSLFKSPSHIDFESKLTQLGPNSFEYTYSVTNHESYLVPYAWDVAGLSGMLSGGATFTKTVLSSLPATELIGQATFTLEEVVGPFEWRMPADVFAPVPEASTTDMLLAGLCAFGLFRLLRRRPAEDRVEC